MFLRQDKQIRYNPLENYLLLQLTQILPTSLLVLHAVKTNLNLSLKNVKDPHKIKEREFHVSPMKWQFVSLICSTLMSSNSKQKCVFMSLTSGMHWPNCFN